MTALLIIVAVVAIALGAYKVRQHRQRVIARAERHERRVQQDAAWEAMLSKQQDKP
jgi:membrane protein required for beta-lactamase induction